MRLQQKHITLQIQCDFQNFFLIAHNSKIFWLTKGRTVMMCPSFLVFFSCYHFQSLLKFVCKIAIIKLWDNTL